MKRDVYIACFARFIFCLLAFTFFQPGSANGILFAQDSLKPPKVTPALNPRVIHVPKTAGGSYVQQTIGGPRIIKLEPPKVFYLPAVTTFVGKEKEAESKVPDQFSSAHGFFTNYTTDNGLALDMISFGQQSALCDHLGNLWFGTSGGGLSRYDGKSFTNYSTNHGLSNNQVQAIVEDRNNNIWFGTYGGGAICYDGKSFTSLTPADGLSNDVVWCIKEDKEGNLWFGTNGGGVS